MKLRNWSVLVGVLLLLSACFFAIRSWPIKPVSQPEQRIENSKEPLPVLSVAASYPGANAQEVAESVATPIEQQINGIEDLVNMRSWSRDDGSYELQVTFKHGTDLNMAQVLLQNRVALAIPALPDAVKVAGVTTKKDLPYAVLLVALSSPKGTYDALYMSNYAKLQLMPELVTVAGVGDVVLLGQRRSFMQAILDPKKFEAAGLTAADVVRAVEQLAKMQDAGKRQDRITQEDQFSDLVLTTGGQGQVVRLRDVAKIQLGPEILGEALVSGQPSVVVAIHGLPGMNIPGLKKSVTERLNVLRKALPENLGMEVVADFISDQEQGEWVRIDLDLPDTASKGRTGEVAKQCDTVVRTVDGVKKTLVVLGAPLFRADNRACLLVYLEAGSGAKAREAIRSRLQEQIKEANARLCDVTLSHGFRIDGYALDLAVYGPDRESVGKFGEKLAERLRQRKDLTDVWLASGQVPKTYVTIDREAAKQHGVSIDEIHRTLRVYYGLATFDQQSAIAPSWQITLNEGGATRNPAEGLRTLMVRNQKKEVVPLSTLLKMENVIAPLVVERFNQHPMVQITANAASGVSLAEARSRVQAETEAVHKELGLAQEFRWAWIGEPLKTR